MLDEVGVEVLDLLLRELDVLEPGDDLVVGEKALLLTLCDELVELLDVGKRDVDGEHGRRLSSVSRSNGDYRPTDVQRAGPPVPPGLTAFGARILIRRDDLVKDRIAV